MKQSLDTRTKLLTKNPISLMIELSIPAVLGMVVVGLYNMMDSIFVGQMVGAAQMGSCIGIISIYFDKCRFCRNAGRWFRFGTFTSDW